jgi:hypothetical protein
MTILDRFRTYWRGMREHYVRWLRSWTFPRIRTNGGNWRRDNPLHALANIIIEGPRVEEKVSLWIDTAMVLLAGVIGWTARGMF